MEDIPTDDICIKYLESKWRSILKTRFEYFFQKSPESGDRMTTIIGCMIEGLKSLFISYGRLKDTTFNKQIMLDDVDIYSQRMAELLFYSRLLRMNFEDIKSNDAGPDFVATKNGVTFCFEVITPTPQDRIKNLIKQRKLDQEDRNTVFRERLLSVTSAIKAKREQFERHKKAGHVPVSTHYIIVVNDSLLLPYDQPWYGVMGELCFGNSSLPITVDATLGTSDIDFTNIFGDKTSGTADAEFRSLVVRHSLGVSMNGGDVKNPEPSLLRLQIRKTIPTRRSANTVDVDIIESMDVTGIYQITLREDLMFFYSFEFTQHIMPPSALISSVKNKNLVRDNILFTSTYAIDENLVQPKMASARLFGLEPDQLNSQAIYETFFRPVLNDG